MVDKWYKSRMLLLAVEHLLIVAALFSAIPPARSSPETVYHFFPDGVIAVAFFGASRFLAHYRGCDTWPIICFQVLLCALAVGVLRTVANLW